MRCSDTAVVVGSNPTFRTMAYKNIEDKRAGEKRYRLKLRRQALAILGGKCCRCGFDDYRALQVDHINGGGRAEQEIRGNGGIYRKIRDGETEEYQLLCSNCNWIKKYERNEFRK